MHEGNKLKLRAILHTGKIKPSAAMEYGGWIKLRNVDFANGKIKFNVLIQDQLPMAILVRYKDPENYYAVELSPQPTGNVKLIERIDGGARIIYSGTAKILEDKWYSVAITLNFQKIKVALQSHTIRRFKTIIKFKHLNLARGTIAFASAGNQKFYISGVQIDKYSLEKDKYKHNHRSWGTILKGLKEKERMIYCKELFNSLRFEVTRCVEIHNYCQLRCDKKFSKVENLLNFACQRDCVKMANIVDSKKDALSDLLKKSGWIPKKGEKCDYKPKGEDSYRLCLIKDVVQRGTNKIIVIQYNPDGNAKIKAEIKWPDKNLNQCGSKLTNRMDCLQK